MARAQDVGTYLLIFVSGILQRIIILPHSNIPHSVSKKAFRTLAVHGVAIESDGEAAGEGDVAHLWTNHWRPLRASSAKDAVAQSRCFSPA